MGLDMYLNAKLFMPFSKPKQRVVTIKKLFPEFKSKQLDYVVFEAGYWRKANEIHKWFIENIQDGKDDCGVYSVEREQLKELLELCKEVLKNNDKAKDILPTQEGFFFGNTEYNKYYFEDLKNTIEIIEKVLKLPEDWELEYHSSW